MISDASSIENTIVDKERLVDVYDMNGVLWRSKVKSDEALKGLPQGYYIVGDNKVLIK